VSWDSAASARLWRGGEGWGGGMYESQKEKPHASSTWDRLGQGVSHTTRVQLQQSDLSTACATQQATLRQVLHIFTISRLMLAAAPHLLPPRCGAGEQLAAAHVDDEERAHGRACCC